MNAERKQKLERAGFRVGSADDFLGIPMKNPHIIVGEGNRCVCGTYQIGEQSRAIGCADVLTAINGLKQGANLKENAQIVEAVIAPLVVDVDAP